MFYINKLAVGQTCSITDTKAKIFSALTPPLPWPASLITEQTRLPSSHEAEPNEHIIVFTLR